MKRLFALLIFLFCSLNVFSQKDLKNLIEDLSDLTGIDLVITTSTFKSTRVMNGHSVESMAPGDLDFRISHRFGKINSGAYEFFGLDEANIHFKSGIWNHEMADDGSGKRDVRKDI